MYQGFNAILKKGKNYNNIKNTIVIGGNAFFFTKVKLLLNCLKLFRLNWLCLTSILEYRKNFFIYYMYLLSYLG